MKRARISIVLPSTPAYSETFFRSKIKGLQKYGYSVLLVTAKKDTQFDLCEQRIHPKIYKNKGIQLVMMLKVFLSLSIYYKPVLAYYKLEQKEQTPIKRILEKLYLNATLLKLKVDWLHFGFATMALERELVAKAIGATMAVSFRGFDINVYPLKYTSCYKKLWNYVDVVHSISIDLYQKACNIGLSETKPCQIISPAVESSVITQSIEYKELNAPIKILTIARLHYIKGIDILIDTAKTLKGRGVNFIWRVVGSGDSQSLKRYKYHIYSLGLEDAIILEGKKTHEVSLEMLEQTNIYVQPSYSEGFCNALLEAQAKGKLCVAFSGGGMSENVIDTSTGFLVSQVSGNALSSKIVEVMALSQQVKIDIARQAVERVKEKFTLEQQQQAFLKFYSTLI